MIHLITGYAGYEHIKSEDEGAFNASFFGSGQFVMEEGKQFEGSIIDNNTVRILDGNGLMYGRHFRMLKETYEDVIISTGKAGTNRMDLICITYEKNENDGTESTYLQVIKGVENEGTPVVPAYVQGNILEGAILNQMPLYKVSIEGVVLADIEPLFEMIPTYKTLAEKSESEYRKTIEALKSSDILDSVEEIEANTQGNMFAGALAVKELSEDLKKFVSDGKTTVANAITGNGVTTATDASFAIMAANVNTACTNKYSAGYNQGVVDADNRANTNSTNYKTGYNAGVNATKVGNATAAQVLYGYSFTNSSGLNWGNMPNHGAWTGSTPNDGGNVAIPAGYHNGSGYVSGANSYNNGWHTGVAAADGRANPSSVNYQTGYNNGVTDADNRENGNSVNWRGGYNAGYAAGAATAVSYKNGTINTGLSGETTRTYTITTGFSSITACLVRAYHNATERDNRIYSATTSGGNITVQFYAPNGVTNYLDWLAIGK